MQLRHSIYKVCCVYADLVPADKSCLLAIFTISSYLVGEVLKENNIQKFGSNIFENMAFQ